MSGTRRPVRRWRRWALGTTLTAGLVLGLTTVVAAPATAAPAAGPPVGPRELGVSVLTFNIHAGIGADNELDLQRVADVIRAADVDVVALQEVDRHWSARSDFVDQPTWLAEELGMHVVYGANLDLDPLVAGQPRRQYGTAILSVRPIHDWENTLLPRTGTREQRGLLRARTIIRGVPVQVYNTHLQHDSADERLLQARALVDRIGTPTGSTLLLGDLNATPDTPEIAVVRESVADVWPVVGVGDGFTIPVEGPNRRIDYVMYALADPRTAEVISTPASDHLPVRSDLVLPPRR